MQPKTYCILTKIFQSFDFLFKSPKLKVLETSQHQLNRNDSVEQDCREQRVSCNCFMAWVRSQIDNSFIFCMVQLESRRITQPRSLLFMNRSHRTKQKVLRANFSYVVPFRYRYRQIFSKIYKTAATNIYPFPFPF